MALIWCAELPRLRPFIGVDEKEKKNGCLNFKSAFKRAVWTGQTDDPQTYKKGVPPYTMAQLACGRAGNWL